MAMKLSPNMQHILNWTHLWLLSTFSRCGMKSQATPGLLSTHVLQATNCVCLEMPRSSTIVFGVFLVYMYLRLFCPAENAIVYIWLVNLRSVILPIFRGE